MVEKRLEQCGPAQVGRLIPVLQLHDVEQVRRSARQVGDRARLRAPDLDALAHGTLRQMRWANAKVKETAAHMVTG